MHDKLIRYRHLLVVAAFNILSIKIYDSIYSAGSLRKTNILQVPKETKNHTLNILTVPPIKIDLL